jgi:3-oxoacyl-[acyl-carrier-protein] synthase-1
MNDGAVLLLALGACTAIGRDVPSSAAAHRAGLAGFTEHPYMMDTTGEPMRVAMVPWLESDFGVAGRIESLLCEAVEQVLARSREALGAEARLGLAIALPAARPGLPLDAEALARGAIRRRFGAVFSAVAVFPHGHAAGGLALEAGLHGMARRAFDACVVVGADSYIDPDTLTWLEQGEQLHGAGMLNNAWGFVPGEGAGAVLLAHADVAARGDFHLAPQLLRVASATERNGSKSTRVCVGEGLTEALRSALSATPEGVKVSDIFCDMNGEPYRADEYGFACLRLGERLPDAADFIAPADCWGDVGAASVPLYMGLATMAGLKGYAKGDCALVWASSEAGQRAAAVMRIARGG